MAQVKEVPCWEWRSTECLQPQTGANLPPNDRCRDGLRIGLTSVVTDEQELDPLDPEGWFREPNVCGSCIAWRCEARDGDEIATGPCRLRPELGRIPADLKKCDRYMQRGGYTYRPNDAAAPSRRRSKTLSVIKRPGAEPESRPAKASPKSTPSVGSNEPPRVVRLEVRPKLPFPRPTPPKEVELGRLTSLPVVRQALVELVRDEFGRSKREIHPRFKGGTVRAVPTAGAANEIPVEQLFAHLDHVLNSLALLESKLGQLDEAEDMKKQLNGIRGSFTTFNVLFAHRDEGFSS